MGLIKDGYWDIVNGSETRPVEEGQARRKFMSRQGRALAVIGLTIDPSLLYFIRDPKNVWDTLQGQFQRKTWANKLHLRRKLFGLKLRDGHSVKDHIKSLTETFEALAVIGDPIEEEDRVVFLLASLPDSYDVLVTALEAQSEKVPKCTVVTERLFHQEQKFNKKDSDEKALHADDRATPTKRTKALFTCHFCKRPGHFKRDCRKYMAFQKKNNKSANAVEETRELQLTSHALTSIAKGTWIVDSGATTHMCNEKSSFVELKELKTPERIKLGDGHTLDGIAEGTVELETLCPDGSATKCRLENTLLVPDLSFSLLSVSKTSSAGKTTHFDKNGCTISNEKQNVIAFATKVGNLYYLEHCRKLHAASTAESTSKEKLCHRRYGHLGEQNLQRIAKNKLADEFDFDAAKSIGFCESCVNGKIHRSSFPRSSSRTSKPLEIVHSDVCGKMREKSLGGGEYFLTFNDDLTRYSSVYILKSKAEVFERFVEWKTFVERQSRHKLKILRTDNGGEYTSNQFQQYLKKLGIRHEKTVPKTPEQNGEVKQNHCRVSKKHAARL